jgi:Lrp/AsnC family transcriptional regulator for asnA, asnC and gidA
MRRKTWSIGRPATSAPDGRVPTTLGDLDATDFRIIRLLQENGRATNIEIARAIGVTEGTVRRRIDRLTSSNIIKVVAVLNPTKTGYLTDAIIAVTTERGGMLKAGASLARLPEVVYVSYTTGQYDIIVEVLFRSDDELFAFLTETLSKIEGIRSSVTFHVLSTAKINYDWKLPFEFLTNVERYA